MTAIVIIALLVVLGYVLGIVGFFRAGAAMREARELRRLLASEIARRGAEATRSAAAPEAAPPPSPTPPEPHFSEPETPESIDPTLADGVAPSAPPPRPPSPPLRRDFEQMLTMRWAVWLGAVSLLLAGVFLIRYAAEQGMLGPGMRCTAAVLLGVALLAGATRLRRAGVPPAAGPFAIDQAPAALAAGGVAVLFGAAYGAGPYYHLLPEPLAFAAMAAVSFLGLAAALAFGPLTAAVGIVGAFVAPALIETHSPSLVGLFAYLTVATAGAQAVVRRSAWTWLGWAVTTGGALWVVAAAAGDPRNPQLWAAAVFVPVVATIGLWLPPAALETKVGRTLAWGQFAIIAAAGLALERIAPSGASRLAIFALTPLAIWKGAIEPRLDRLPWLAALCGLGALYLWDHLPQRVFGFAAVSDSVGLIAAAIAFAATHAAAGLVQERRADRPLPWAALVAAVPVATLALCYGAVGRFAPDIRWGLCSLLPALLLAANAERAMARDAKRAGVHAAGAVAALALAFAMTLHDQWLTVALALILPGLGWIEGKVGLRALRPVAAVVAGLTMAILASWLLHDLARGHLLFTREPFVTYGLPALAFFAAAYLFRRGGDDRLVAMLEAGCAGTTALFVTLEVRRLFGHQRLDDDIGFDELATLMLALGAQALAYHRIAQRTGRVVPDVARNILGGIALLLAAGFILYNPAFFDQDVTSLSLALAYLVPALLASQVGRFAHGPYIRNLLVGYAVVAGFAWVTLQVRHLFHPAAMALWRDDPTEAEMWTWSGAWLLYGCVIMLIGLRTESRALRLTAVSLLGLVTGKVFLFDMAELTGLWRVASFLGLGLALIGLGAVYRRFVLPRAADG